MRFFCVEISGMNNSSVSARALDRVIAIIGSQSQLARDIGVKPQAVQQWVAAGEVPTKRVLACEALTNAQVTRYELRPDIYGASPDEAA